MLQIRAKVGRHERPSLQHAAAPSWQPGLAACLSSRLSEALTEASRIKALTFLLTETHGKEDSQISLHNKVPILCFKAFLRGSYPFLRLPILF